MSKLKPEEQKQLKRELTDPKPPSHIEVRGTHTHTHRQTHTHTHTTPTTELSSLHRTSALAQQQAPTLTPNPHQEIDPSDPAFTKRGPLPEVEPPSMISLTLLPYQKEGHGWMVQQELNPDYRGGVLADEVRAGCCCLYSTFYCCYASCFCFVQHQSQIMLYQSTKKHMQVDMRARFFVSVRTRVDAYSHLCPSILGTTPDGNGQDHSNDCHDRGRHARCRQASKRQTQGRRRRCGRRRPRADTHRVPFVSHVAVGRRSAAKHP
jgi:hypothetical protein